MIPSGLGGPELIIILILAMMIFGVGKLGSVGASLGKGVREFKSGIAGRTNEDQNSLNS